MIGAVTTVVSLAQRMGWRGFAIVVGVLSVVGGVVGGIKWTQGQLAKRESAAFARGVQVGRASSPVDSLLRAHAIERQQWAERRTDSTVATVRAVRKQVAPAVAALPPEVAALPSVQLVVRVTTQLERATDSLDQSHLAERAAHHLRQAADSAVIAAQSVVITISRDSMAVLERELSRRPTWTQTGLAMVAAAITGFLGGLGR